VVKVFTRYEEKHAALIVLWARGWRNQGWTPRLDVHSKGKFHPPVKTLVPVNVMNFGLHRPRSRPRRLKWTQHGHPGWEKAPLVLFPDSNPDTILTCGRVL
jgi:hypothetical protein